jgi:AraC-like DNA-binding protein
MSTPSYRLINPQANQSFVFKWEHFDLSTRWHYHPELELIYFIDGKTSGVIGEGFYQFEEGDVVLLGANFPHVLQEHSEYVRQFPHQRPFGLIIQFTESFLGKDFIQKPEIHSVKELFKKAQRGLLFKKSITQKVSEALLEMHKLSETRKLIALLEILITLADSEDYNFLTPKDYAYDHTQDEDRMRLINEFVYEHFKEPISIQDIASVANMTGTSFCRYFKTRTLKTFTHFLNEVRIAYACRLLNNSNYTVTNACFESGFNNLSYFTRQYKAIMKMSPRQYQKWKKKAVREI